MKKILLIVLFFGAAAYANDYGYGNNKSNSESEAYKYKSSTGNKYKYDLSKPMDRVKYSVDVKAQLKDSISPNVELDRGLGQYGGGIKDR